jgi:hypothetical protein
MRLRAALGIVMLAGAGCAGDGSRLVDDTMGGPEPTLASIQQEIFGAICVNCHVPGGAAEFMVLDSEPSSYASLVGQPSVEVNMLRVVPGDPDLSYLVWKIEGQGPNGEPIAPERMPPPSAGEPPLTAQEIALVRQWIEDGALP